MIRTIELEGMLDVALATAVGALQAHRVARLARAHRLPQPRRRALARAHARPTTGPTARPSSTTSRSPSACSSHRSASTDERSPVSHQAATTRRQRRRRRTTRLRRALRGQPHRARGAVLTSRSARTARSASATAAGPPSAARCAMYINGRYRLACQTNVSQLHAGDDHRSSPCRTCRWSRTSSAT